MARKSIPKNYIYFHLGDDKNKNAQAKYSQTLSSFSSKITGPKLASSFKKRVSDVYKPTSKTELDKIITAGNYLKNSRFTEDLNKIMSTITTNILSQSGVSLSGTGVNKRAMMNGKNLAPASAEAQKILDDMEKMMETIVAVFQQKDFGPYLRVLKDIYKGDAAMQEALTLMGQGVNGSLTKDRFEVLNSGAKNSYKKIQTMMDTIKSKETTLASYVRNKYINTAKISGTDSAKNEFAKLLGTLSFIISILGGLMNEAMVVDVVNSRKFISLLTNSLNAGYQVKSGSPIYISNIQHVGASTANDNLAFKYATTDIQMSLINGRGQVRVEIPVGASLKVSAASSKGNINNVHIKSSSFHKLMAITKSRVLPGLWDDDVDAAIANVFANYKVTSPLKMIPRKSYDYPNMNVLLNALNHSFLVAGLAGGLTSQDLATVFIVNDQVYNIYDIIKKSHYINVLGGLNESIIGRITKFDSNKWVKLGKEKKPRPNDDAAIRRSQAFYQDLMLGKKNIYLNLKLNMKL